MTSVDGGPFFEQQQHVGVLQHGEAGTSTELKAANLNHIVRHCVSFFDPKPNKRLIKGAPQQPEGSKRIKRRRSLNALPSPGKRRLAAEPQFGSPGQQYALTAQDVNLKEDVTKKMMALVKSGNLSIEDTLEIVKGSDDEIRQAFAWHDAKNGFPAMVFRTYNWFAPQDILMLKFLDMYHVPKKPAMYLLPNSFTSWDASARKTVKRAVCHALIYWGLNGRFELDESRAAVDGLLEELRRDDVLGAAELDRLETVLLHPPAPALPPSGKETDGVLEFASPLYSAQVLAEQLTILDWQFLRRIRDDDFRLYIKAKANQTPDCPRLLEAIDHTNALGQWVVVTILSDLTMEGRADLVTKFVSVCKFLKQLGNYNSLMSISGAFSHASVGRLKHTFGRLSKATARDMAELELLMNPQNNHEALRSDLQQTGSVGIPYLGLHLKDVMSIHNSYENMQDGLINVQKFSLLHTVLKPFYDAKNTEPEIPSVPEVQSKLLNSMRGVADQTEKELYATSLKLEPRNAEPPPAQRKVEAKAKAKPPKTSRTLKTPTKPLGRTPSKTLRRRNANPYFASAAIPSNPGSGAVAAVPWPRSKSADCALAVRDDGPRGHRPERFSAAAILQSFALHALPSLCDHLEDQVNQLVDALMFNFATGKSGHITPEGFTELKHVFTHLSSFEIIDGDGDGIISRDDLASYLFKVANIYEVLESQGHQFLALDDPSGLTCSFCKTEIRPNDEAFSCQLCNGTYHTLCTVLLGECEGGRVDLAAENERLKAQLAVMSRRVEVLEQTLQAQVPPATEALPEPAVDELLASQSAFSGLTEVRENHKDVVRTRAKYFQAVPGQMLQAQDERTLDVLFAHSGQFLVWPIKANGGLGEPSYRLAGSLLSELEAGVFPSPAAILCLTAGGFWRLPAETYGMVLKLFSPERGAQVAAVAAHSAPDSVSGSPILRGRRRVSLTNGSRFSPRRVIRRSVFDPSSASVSADPFADVVQISKQAGDGAEGGGDIFSSLALGGLGAPQDNLHSTTSDASLTLSLSSRDNMGSTPSLDQDVFESGEAPAAFAEADHQTPISPVAEVPEPAPEKPQPSRLGLRNLDHLTDHTSSSSLPAMALDGHSTGSASPEAFVSPPKSRRRSQDRDVNHVKPVTKRGNSYCQATAQGSEETILPKLTSEFLISPPKARRRSRSADDALQDLAAAAAGAGAGTAALAGAGLDKASGEGEEDATQWPVEPNGSFLALSDIHSSDV